MKKSFFYTLLTLLLLSLNLFGDDGLPVAEIKRSEPVDFDKEILPILRQNCLACHNSTDAEGDVILENVAKILESEAVVAGKPDESSLFSLSAHRDDPIMPPEDNEVKAENLTSQQLGLLKLWIAEGAKPSAVSTANKVEFAKLPAGVNPVYAMAMSQNGQYLAAGRANQIFVYQVPNKQFLERVTDPGLLKSSPYKKPGVAHLDIVQSLAFSPDNQTFVSGGFRTVKIWQKTPNQKTNSALGITEPIASSARSNQNEWVAFGGINGAVFLLNNQTKKITSSLTTGDKAVDAVATQNDGSQLAVVTEKKKMRLFDVATQKQTGNEITLPADAVALAFIEENKKLVVSYANNVMEVFPIELFNKDPKDKLVAERKLAGHGKPVLHLRPFGDKDAKLITASDDGTAKIWNLANGQQVRTFSHGGAICSLEISKDEQRVATCGTNGSLKIFNATNSSLVKEVRGDASVEFQVATNDRLVRLKQLLINVAKADLDAANKERTAEDANVKKTEEALKKADEELKKKLEAKTKADTDFDNANKPHLAKKMEVESLQKQKTELEGKVKQVTAMTTALNNAAKAVDANLQKANTAKASAAKQLNDANTKLAADKENADLKKSAESAKQMLVKSEEALKVAQEAKAKNTTDRTAANERLKVLNTQKTELDKKLNAANAEVKKQEPNIKKLTDAQKKATDEHTAATRNQTLAKNSVDRAKTRAKKAADKVPVLDAKHKAAEKAKADQTQVAATFKTAHAKKLTSLTGMVRMDDGSLVYRDAAGHLGRCDFSTGEMLDSTTFPESVNAKLLVAAGNQLLAISGDGTSLNTLSFETGWQLARTIGNIDDVNTFVDRVTAVDISPDGKWLATGSGEPSRSGEIKIWNLADGKLVKEIKDAHSDTILDIKFSPDGSKVASGSSDRFMKTFDLATGKMIRVFEGHTHHVMSVDWNSTGRELSSAGADKVVKVWDAETGTQKRTITGYGKEVTSLSFVELSNNIITTSGDRTVRLKRTDNGGELRQFSGNSDFVYTVATSADGKKFAAGGEDSVVRVWNDNGQMFVEFPAPKE